MRILAIDYGAKRTGLAVTDPFQIIATGLETVETSKLMTYLTNYFTNESVEGIVIGKPLTLRNELNPIYSQIETLIKKLKSNFPTLFIYELDERFTSKMAQQAILDSGATKKQRRDKSKIDLTSAVILLQNYMDLKKNKLND